MQPSAETVLPLIDLDDIRDTARHFKILDISA